MYLIYNRFTAVEVRRFNDWAQADAELRRLNAPTGDGDPYALRLDA